MTETRDVERYLAGTLSEDESARFEEAMIGRPELAADVGVRRRIKAGLRRLEQNHELEVLLKEEPGRSNHFRYAAAASVLVIVAAGLLTIWKPQQTAPLRAMFNSTGVGSKTIAASFILGITRSAEKPVYEVKRHGGPVALRIVVDDTATAPFRVQLMSAQTGAAAIQDSSVTEVTDGFAVIYVDPRELASGDYTLALTPATGAEQILPFRLSVLP